MKVDLQKFGEILVSRPAGREACLVARAYLAPKNGTEPIELDFSGVMVLAPSWVDEFTSGLRETWPNPIIFLPSDNASVIESLKMLGEKL